MIRISSLVEAPDLISFFDLEQEIDEGWTMEMISTAYKSGTSKFSKAVYALSESSDHEKIVGYINYSVVLDEAEINSIVVLPSFRGRGIAQKLIDSIVSECKNSIKSIFLEVNENNIPAISLYRKCGFEHINTRKKYYGNNSALIFRKKV